MLAVTTSEIQPMPHQRKAVYQELLPRTPLRFLLADDPGAGKTIRAGLYIKELMLREDVHRCLIVAPGGLVDQWQDELYLKFGLRFEIFNTAQTETVFTGSSFEDTPLLIARMDQLARNEELLDELTRSEWDLVVVDEAHRMGAHYFSGKLEKTKPFQLVEVLGLITRHLLLMPATPLLVDDSRHDELRRVFHPALRGSHHPHQACTATQRLMTDFDPTRRLSCGLHCVGGSQ